MAWKVSKEVQAIIDGTAPSAPPNKFIIHAVWCLYRERLAMTQTGSAFHLSKDHAANLAIELGEIRAALMDMGETVPPSTDGWALYVLEHGGPWGRTT